MLMWGAMGGVLPTIAKIASGFAANFDAPFPNAVGVLIALGGYAFLGAVIGRAMGNPDMKQALIAGIAAPAILTNVVNGVSESKVRLSDLFGNRPTPLTSARGPF